ncbi:hypothetical protein HMPREF0027_2426 [Actinobacillus ureae ATCC 25976]|uniref:Uncharacterized protein n=1 Tax=Actinobacillus ureae ATCC 25976 TaxID=887324 RepID=E8KKQ9_9PAST|nr:hypothetical protein HMPREF0027_2426 [Actinobacillus ureae ATCC 25976]KMZ33167.1 hypothetical protein ABN30_02095 [Haemophilus influenzae]
MKAFRELASGTLRTTRTERTEDARESQPEQEVAKPCSLRNGVACGRRRRASEPPRSGLPAPTPNSHKNAILIIFDDCKKDLDRNTKNNAPKQAIEPRKQANLYKHLPFR